MLAANTSTRWASPRPRPLLPLPRLFQLLAHNPAKLFGLPGGKLAKGAPADLVVFDADTVGPRMPEVVTDLPAGAKRLKQTCEGMHATIVNGEVLLRGRFVPVARRSMAVAAAFGVLTALVFALGLYLAPKAAAAFRNVQAGAEVALLDIDDPAAQTRAKSIGGAATAAWCVAPPFPS